ncbi:ATP-grasp domain-containing protein [bacterium]|nr:ATP-grasp domain-containing protein [bacterium]
MKLYEYQAKRLFERHGIPVPQGLVTAQAEEVRAFVQHLGTPVVIKAQVHVSGRGRQGGILSASTPHEAFLQAQVLLGTIIAGQRVRQVLVEQFIESEQRIFLALRYDRTKRQPLLAAAIEERRKVISSTRPERILTATIHPLRGLLTYQVHEIASHMELPYDLWQPFVNTVMQLYHFYEACDAEYVELDPLVTTAQHTIVALNGRAIIDDSALPRQTEIAALLLAEPLTAAAQIARDSHLLYVPLQGQVGAIVNGSGAGLALMDMLSHFSKGDVCLTSFIDLQSRETLDNFIQAFHILNAEPTLEAIIVTLFSGRIETGELAYLLTQALSQGQPSVPLILRIEGVGAAEAQAVLRRIRYAHVARTLSEAVWMAHTLLKGRSHVNFD